MLLHRRAERDRASIYSELQQTRGAVDQVAREKVLRSPDICLVVTRPALVIPALPQPL